jgi:5'-3' exonuclease
MAVSLLCDKNINIVKSIQHSLRAYSNFKNEFLKRIAETGPLDNIVDFVDEVLSKILLGDKSDNIPKITSVTPTKAKKVISAVYDKFGDTIISQIDDLNEEVISSIVSEIQIVNKIKDQDKIDEIREHLLFNIKLTRLSIKVFPDEIRDSLIEFFKSYQMTTFNSREFTNLKNNLSSL